jgi:DNA-binding transcriptional ArsR family regulator
VTKVVKRTADSRDESRTREAIVERAREDLLDDMLALGTAEIFHVLGDTNRIRILHLLSTREMCVCDLAEATGIEQSAVSHNLRLLRHARIVRFRREGKQVFYTLDDDHIAGLLRQGVDHARHATLKGDEDE